MPEHSTPRKIENRGSLFGIFFFFFSLSRSQQPSCLLCSVPVNFFGSGFLRIVFIFSSQRKTHIVLRESRITTPETSAARDTEATSSFLLFPSRMRRESQQERHTCVPFGMHVLLAPEERVTPEGYHVWNWNPRGTGSERKQARQTGSLGQHLAYLGRTR